MKRKFVMLFGALGAVVLGACATFGGRGFTAPEVHFQDLRVEGVGLNGGTLDVVLNVFNPNNVQLDGKRLTYRLMIDSTTLGEGVYDKPFTLNAADSTTVHFPISLDYNGLAVAGRQLMGKGAVTYRVVGDVTVGTTKGDFTRPFDQTGRFTTFGGVTR